MKKIIIVNTTSFTLLLLLIMASLNSCGQNFVYKSVPSAYLPTINPKYLAEVQIYKQGAVDLTKYLPSSFVKDGSRDYTKELQQGINLNKVMLMPNFPISTTGINLPDNSTLIFQKNSKLLMVTTDANGYNVIGIKGVNNVNIYFANIVGDRKQHVGDKGEWGFGIGIFSSTNVKIINPSVSDCWGDGIYINNKLTGTQIITDNIEGHSVLIDGAKLDNNRRNGLSLIDGHNILIKNSIMSNTNGTSPMAGLDIEPNNGNGQLKNITLDRVTTFNNKSWGIFVSLSAFKSEEQKAVKITIDSCVDDGSPYGMGFANGRSKDDDLIYATGNIDVIAPVWKNNLKGEVWLPFFASKNTVKLNIQKPRVYKAGQMLNTPIKPINLTNSKNINILQ